MHHEAISTILLQRYMHLIFPQLGGMQHQLSREFNLQRHRYLKNAIYMLQNIS